MTRSAYAFFKNPSGDIREPLQFSRGFEESSRWWTVKNFPDLAGAALMPPSYKKLHMHKGGEKMTISESWKQFENLKVSDFARPASIREKLETVLFMVSIIVPFIVVTYVAVTLYVGGN